MKKMTSLNKLVSGNSKVVFANINNHLSNLFAIMFRRSARKIQLKTGCPVLYILYTLYMIMIIMHHLYNI